MESAEAIQDEIKTRKSRALRTAFLFGLLVTLVLLFSLRGFSITVAGAIAVYIYVRLSQGSYLIVWFRRFHAGNERKACFRWLLRESTKQMGVAVTLQDSVFKYTYMKSPALLISTYFLLLQPAVLVSAVGAALLTRASGNDNTAFQWAVFALLFAPLGALIVRFVRKRGYVVLPDKNWRTILEKSIHSILNRRTVRYGVQIYRCGDGVWQEAVQSTLSFARAAVIDVSDLSGNLAWEIATSLQYLPPESIILAYSQPVQGPSDGRLPDEIRANLCQQMDASSLARCRVFPYAPDLPAPGPGRAQYVSSRSAELRSLLNGAVAASSGVVATAPKRANAPEGGLPA